MRDIGRQRRLHVGTLDHQSQEQPENGAKIRHDGESNTDMALFQVSFQNNPLTLY